MRVDGRAVRGHVWLLLCNGTNTQTHTHTQWVLVYHVLQILLWSLPHVLLQGHACAQKHVFHCGSTSAGMACHSVCKCLTPTLIPTSRPAHFHDGKQLIQENSADTMAGQRLYLEYGQSLGGIRVQLWTSETNVRKYGQAYQHSGLIWGTGEKEGNSRTPPPPQNRRRNPNKSSEQIGGPIFQQNRFLVPWISVPGPKYTFLLVAL